MKHKTYIYKLILYNSVIYSLDIQVSDLYWKTEVYCSSNNCHVLTKINTEVKYAINKTGNKHVTTSYFSLCKFNKKIMQRD